MDFYAIRIGANLREGALHLDDFEHLPSQRTRLHRIRILEEVEKRE